MSRNFELLQRAQRERKVFQTSRGPAMVDTAGLRPACDLAPGLPRDVVLALGRLVQRLFFTPDSRVPQVVVFSPVQEEQEPDWVGPRVAESLTRQSRRSVCIIDANVPSPTAHRYFGVANRAGLLDALQSAAPLEEFLYRVPDGELAVMTTGARTPNWESLLLSHALQLRLLECRQAHDHVLVLAPSVRTTPASLRLACLSDGVVLVLRAHQTHREAALRAKRELVQEGVNLLGAVLDNRTFPIPQAVYSRL